MEKTINDIKYNHMKIITSLDMSSSAMNYNKPYSYLENIKAYLTLCIILQSTGNHHNSLNICLQSTLGETPNNIYENCEFLLNQNHIYLLFGQTFANPSQYLAPGAQTKKHSNRRFTSSKQKLFIHQQHQYQQWDLK